MKHTFIAWLCLSALSALVMPTLADDPGSAKCLDCHEPAEDWSGMSVEEIIVEAKSPDNKRHADNQAFSDEQLRVIIVELMPE